MPCGACGGGLGVAHFYASGSGHTECAVLLRICSLRAASRAPTPAPPCAPPPRQGADALAAAQVAVAIAKACWSARDVKQLNAQVLAFCKRRGQLKQVRGWGVCERPEGAQTRVPLS